jgi:hypothetical protein
MQESAVNSQHASEDIPDGALSAALQIARRDRAHNGRPSRPQARRGQLWVGSDGKDSLYLLVVSAADDVADVIPCDTIGDLYSHGPYIIEATHNPLKEKMLAWPEMVTAIPNSFLYNYMGDVASCIVDSLASAKRKIAAAMRAADDDDDDDDDVSDIREALRRWHAKI